MIKKQFRCLVKTDPDGKISKWVTACLKIYIDFWEKEKDIYNHRFKK